MKTCSRCKHEYDDTYNFCLLDGTVLSENTPDQSAVYQPPPLASPPDPFEITLGDAAPMQMPPPSSIEMPSSSGRLQSFGGLERLGPVGKLKRFFFGDR